MFAKERDMRMKHGYPLMTLMILWLAGLATGAVSIKASEETVTTYPFFDPDPIPILARSGTWEGNARLYPYHFFDGFSETSE